MSAFPKPYLSQLLKNKSFFSQGESGLYKIITINHML